MATSSSSHQHSQGHDHNDGHRHHVDRETTPAHTEQLQEEYRIELERRFENVRGAIRTTVSTNDALELGDPARRNTGRRAHADEDDVGTPTVEAREEFAFAQRASKQAAFANQLREWFREGILEPAGPGEVTRGSHWTATYVQAGYRAGVEWAEEQLSEAERNPDPLVFPEAFNLPIHRDTLEDIYTRDYEALEDITSDADQTLSRVLARGLSEGWNPRKTADELTGELRDIQRSRARTLARTETMHAHTQGTIRRYEGVGVERVEVLGHTPCPICEPFVGETYAIDDLPHGGPPFHPNCVGVLTPVIT